MKLFQTQVIDLMRIGKSQEKQFTTAILRPEISVKDSREIYCVNFRLTMKMFRHNIPFVGHFPADKYTDLKLTTAEEAEGGRGAVPCHKVVMAAVSKKLEVMIDKRGSDGHLVVRNVRFEILQKVVGFVYTGSVEVE